MEGLELNGWFSYFRSELISTYYRFIGVVVFCFKFFDAMLSVDIDIIASLFLVRSFVVSFRFTF